MKFERLQAWPRLSESGPLLLTGRRTNLLHTPITNKNYMSTNSLTLKQAAEKFSCALTTLKNWAKNDKLPYTQNGGDKSTRMVDQATVEQMLKDAPGVKSIFHATAKQSEPSACDVQSPQGDEHTSDYESPAFLTEAPSDNKPTVPAASVLPPEQAKEEQKHGAEPKDKPQRQSKPVKAQTNSRNPQAKRTDNSSMNRSQPRLMDVLALASKLPLADRLKLSNRLRRQMEDVY